MAEPFWRVARDRARAFLPAVRTAAKEPGLAPIEGATPYAIRRGGIGVRLRAEDPQVVAGEWGTSLQMLDAHYSFAIDDLRRFGPMPFDVEWQAARAARRGGLRRSRAAARRLTPQAPGGRGLGRVAEIASFYPCRVAMVLVAGLVFGAGASSTLSADNDFSNPASQSSHAREAIDAATGAGPSAGVLALVAAPAGSAQTAPTGGSLPPNLSPENS